MINNTKEYILCAAIWYDDGEIHPQQSVYGVKNGFVLCGYRHCNIIAVMPLRDFNGTTTQGFITNMGRFVNRKDALKIAIRSGQVKYDNASTILFSEDIY